jgi:hypothetical protein
MNYMDNEGARAADTGWHVLPTKPNEKVPGYYDRGEWREMSGWTRYCEMPPSEAEVEAWREWPDCGVSVACGTVLGLDLDIEDPKLLTAVRAVAERTLGVTPLVRFGRKPRAMMVYRMIGQFRSRRVGPLDAMGAGRQFVAFGVHPITNMPYEWETESPATVAPGHLPPVDEARLAAFFDEALQLLPLHLRQTKMREATAGQNPRSGELATREAVEDALQFITPAANMNHDEWVAIGMSVHSALGGDGEDLWDKWSQPDPRYDAKEIPKRWRSFHERGGVSAGTLFHEAKRMGWVPAPGLFLYARDKELASQPHPAQALIDRMTTKALDTAAAPQIAEDEANEADEDDGLRTEIEEDTPERPVLPAFNSAGKDWLLGCDGGLGLFVTECVESSVKEQPWLALAGALACFSTAMGRRFMGPTGVRPNLYVLGVAPSASGKDHPQKWCRELLHTADLDKIIGGSVIASGAGMTSALERHPVQLWVIDEVAALIKAATERGAAAHMAHVNTLMLAMYSMASSTYAGTDYANKTEKPRAVIAQPSLHFFGNTTPSGLWGALASEAAVGGLLGRCLLFESDTLPYPEDRAATLTPSDDLLKAIKAVHAGVPGHQHFAMGGETCNDHPTPYMVPWASKDAALFFKELGITETDRMISMKGSVAQALYGRMRENVQKIALIKAVARDVPAGRPPAITWGDLQWASRVFERCMADMERSLVENVADNEYQSDRNKLAKVIRTVSERDPRGATKSQVIRSCQSIPSRRRDEILDQLEEAGDVRKTVTAAVVGRASTRYVWAFRT